MMPTLRWAASVRALMTYSLIKSLHLVFVIAWMASVFYLPRILVNLVEAGDEPAVKTRLLLMGRRLYSFGHMMFGLAFLFGLTLWLGHLVTNLLPQVVTGHWIDAKLTLVIVLLGYFIWSGKLLRRSAAGGALPAARTLRLFNELPVLVLLAVVFLVIAKPF